MKKIKWCIIGAGGIADRRAIPALLEDSENEIVATLYLCSNITVWPIVGHAWIYVENLSDDRAGQHQSHQTGVGQDIAEVTRNVVIQGTADTHQLAHDALLAVALSDDQQHQNGDQGRLDLTQGNSGSQQDKHQIPGALIAQRLHGIALFDFMVHAYRHTGEDLTHTDDQRTDQNHQSIVQGGEQSGQAGKAGALAAVIAKEAHHHIHHFPRSRQGAAEYARILLS